MGQAKLKRMIAPSGSRLVSEKVPMGVEMNVPPPNNMGGKGETAGGERGNRLETGRNRVNLSVPEPVHQTLERFSEKLGMSVAQVALSAMLRGLPLVAAEVAVVEK